MTKAVWFWVIFALVLLYGFFVPPPTNPNWRIWNWGGNLTVMLLIFILAWSEFGNPVK